LNFCKKNFVGSGEEKKLVSLEVAFFILKLKLGNVALAAFFSPSLSEQ